MSESGCRLDHPAAARFRQCVMDGEWSKAETALNELRNMLDDPSSLKVRLLMLLQHSKMWLPCKGREIKSSFCCQNSWFALYTGDTFGLLKILSFSTYLGNIY